MKKLASLFLFIWIMAFTARSQKVDGVIYYQNSGGKTAAGVQVSAFGCNPTYSLSNGMFTLPCPNKTIGQKLKLIVGNIDNEGKSIEIVNIRQLEWLRVPDKSDSEPIEIIVCYSGQKDEMALRYYGILVRSTNKKFEEKLASIETQIKQGNLGVEEHKILLNQIEQTNIEKVNALKKIEEQAEFIATINLDQASSLVKDALELLQSEEDIEAALTILDSEKLKNAFDVAISIKQKVDRELSNILEGYKLKTNLLTSQFRYKEAIDTYEEVFSIIFKGEIYTYDAYQLLKNYTDLLRDYGLIEVSEEKIKTLNSHKENFINSPKISDDEKLAIEIDFSIMQLLTDISVSNFFHTFSPFLQDLDEKDSIIMHHLLKFGIWADSLFLLYEEDIDSEVESLSSECLQAADSFLFHSHILFDSLLNDLTFETKCNFCVIDLIKSQIYGYSNDSVYLYYLKKGEEKITENKLFQDDNCPGISQYIYLPLSEYYFEHNDSASANEYLQKAIKNLENGPDSIFKEIADVLMEISYTTLLGPEIKEEILLQAIRKVESKVNKNDPKLIPFYTRMGFLIEDNISNKLEEKDWDLSFSEKLELSGLKEKFMAAIEWHKKALSIQEKVLFPYYEDIAITCRTIGDMYYNLSDSNFIKALNYYSRTTEIYAYHDKEESWRIKNVNERIAELYIHIRDYEKALHYITHGTFGNLDTSQYCQYSRLVNYFTLINNFIIQTDEEKARFNWTQTDTLEAVTYIEKGFQMHEEYDSCILKNKEQYSISPENSFFIDVFYDELIEFVGDYYLSVGNYQDAKKVYERYDFLIKQGGYTTVSYKLHPSINWIKYFIKLNERDKIIDILKNESRNIEQPYYNFFSSMEHEWNRELLQKLRSNYSYDEYKTEFHNLILLQSNAISAFENENFQKAIEYYDSLNVYYQSSKNWNLFGLSHYYLKNYDQAVTAYQNALSLSSEYRQNQYYNNIGLAYSKNHQFKEAHDAFTEYEKLFPMEGISFRNWAIYYALQGEKEIALRDLQIAIELGYSDLEWLQTDDSMDSLREEEEFKEIMMQLERGRGK